MGSLHAVLTSAPAVLSLLAAARDSMPPQQEAAYRIGLTGGILLGAFLGGAIVGLLPLLVALGRGRRRFAVGSWTSCVLANFLLGIFLSVPLAVVLTVVVCSMERRDAKGILCPPETEPARNVYEGVPLPLAPVEQPDYAGSSLPPR